MEAWRARLAQGDDEGAWNLFIERYRSLIFAVIRRTLREDEDVDDVFSEVCVNLSENSLALIAAQPEAGKARFSTWLVTVVRHRAIDWIRHREGRRRLLSPEGFNDLQEEIFHRVVREQRSHVEAYELLRQHGLPELSFRDFLKEIRATYKIIHADGKGVGRYFPGPPLELIRAEMDPEASAMLIDDSEQLSHALRILPADERLAVRLFVVDELDAASVAKIVGWPNAKAVYNRVSRALERLRRELSRQGRG